MSHLRRIAVLLLISLTAAYGLAVAPARAAGTEAIKAAEIGVARDFIATQASALGIAGDAQLQDPRPWADLGHALVNVKEFIYLQ